MPFTKKRLLQLKRTTATFLLLTILNQTLAPTIAYALTSGPTAPEATSFEPIDTTDMVNPLTGDFTYNLPLLEVPGPAGGYPLSLSYHAGIQPNEEASWVGLGWSLNPGAINRNVNGYADDWDSVDGVQRTFWSGGRTKTFGVDVGIGVGAGSVNFGLSFSQDTYKGFGVGGSVGFTLGLKGTPFGVSTSVGITPFGESFMGVNLSAGSGKNGEEGLRIGGSVGISTNFKTVNVRAGAGVSYSDGGGMSTSLLGSSISSSGGKASLTVGGGSASVHNANTGKIQTESSGWGFGIPLPGISIGVSYKNVRYWSDETATVHTYGVLYGHNSTTDIKDFDETADDTYYLLDAKGGNIVDNPDAEKLTGGTYPNFDDYSVTAQGLSGSIRPYLFQGTLYSQNKIFSGASEKNVYQQKIETGLSTVNRKRQFRFINDFSNTYQQSTTAFSNTWYNFGAPTTGTSTAGYSGVNGYSGVIDNRLEGSKHIEYFTNGEIINGTAASKGFIDCNAAGFTRSTQNSLQDQIGGFMITNASGVTYHYALPAYSSLERTRTQQDKNGQRFNDLRKNAPYAYTWYLTAITGPDYVDRSSNGLTNDDWGYWVSFEYGKWAEEYNWRNPSQGFNRDIDNEFKTYSNGRKDVYYLDAVVTKTHTAIFEKELRADGKSFWNRLSDEEPNYKPTYQQECPIPLEYGGNEFLLNYYTHPVATLRLNNIYLINNDQLGSLTISSIRQNSANYNHHFYYQGPADCYNSDQKIHFGQHVIDKYDIPEAIKTKCLRKIQLNYDYSLSKGLPNSYDSNGVIYQMEPAAYPDDNLGKLTLTSIDFQGKGGSHVQPLTEFEYDLDRSEAKNKVSVLVGSGQDNGEVTLQVTGGGEEYSNIQIGDILTFTNPGFPGSQYYGVVLSKKDMTPIRFVTIKYIGAASAAIQSSIFAYKTKNPPYNKDAYDIWGAYKSDYRANNSNNETMARRTSAISNKSTDVWSLRRIKTSLGGQIDVNYEGDTYNRAVLSENNSIIVNSFTKAFGRTYIATVSSEYSASELFTVGRKVPIYLLKFIKEEDIHVGRYSVKSSEEYNEDTKIEQIYSDNEIMIEVPQAFADWIEDVGGYNYSHTIVTGNLTTNTNQSYGGGIRVKDITVNSFSGNANRTSYTYNLPGYTTDILSQGSSGITSYDPSGLPTDNVGATLNNSQIDYSNVIKDYRRLLYKSMNYLLAIAREAPAPGVMYEYVKVQDLTVLPDGTEVPVEGSTLYQYEVFKSNMLGIKDDAGTNYVSNLNTSRSLTYGGVTKQAYIYASSRKNMSIKDFTSRVGNLKRVIRYDATGNKLTETINNYLHDDLNDQPFEQQSSSYESRMGNYNSVSYENQGVIQERYGNSRIYATEAPQGQYLVKGNEEFIMSAKETYPSIQTGVTQIDYKNGTRAVQRNLGYDFYSGAVIKTLTTDSYGNRFINEVKPAYRVSSFAEMGLKTNNPLNKHMLTQEATNYTFRVNAANQPTEVISANAQTWAKTGTIRDENGVGVSQSVWRKQRAYRWLDHGAYSNFVDYYSSGGSTNNNWQRTSDIRQYNVYSNVLEAFDVNGYYSATRTDYNNKVLFNGSLAQYWEIAYSGAEDGMINSGNYASNIMNEGGAILSNDTTKVHTGRKSLRVSAGQVGFTYSVARSSLTSSARDYHLAVWVKPSSSNVNQAVLYYQIGSNTAIVPAQNYNRAAAGWYLLEMTIPASAITSMGASDILKVACKNNGASGDLYFDDFRFQPLSSATTAYVYDSVTGELSYVLGGNNLYTRFQYDAAGRLVRTYKEILGKSTVPLIKSVRYNYGKDNQ
ncbi:hypothetical protein IM792_16205 [Mucilaginibacter sp. JRF]|uniref:hypothetical protein n=1 Tax=Mucilaginibacter sp. JRF TaxID=2780088 RepID=UPI00188007B4|nr:hypothetical protein [Mucilaginibacter sp. JRF]MBE9585998.1 hypothetical protein [Mucilaginibacter sp. JRF]